MSRKFLLIFVIAVVLAAGCASTRLSNVWKAPDYNGNLNNVLVVAVGNRENAERTYEDVFVSHLRERGVQAVPGYEIFGEDNPSEDELRDRVRDGGFDGVILTTLVGVDESTRYIPGETVFIPRLYRTYWGTYGIWYDRYREPGYLDRYKIVRLETTVWDVQQDVMIWTGLSETFDPSSVRSVSRQVANVITKELEEDNVI